MTIMAVVCSVFFGVSGAVGGWPVGTAFTYQGRLIDANEPADGLYDLELKLFDDPNVVIGVQKGGTITIDELDVIDGYFTVELDFGTGIFDGEARWLQIGVRAGDLSDPNAYAPLLPRQELTPTAYAIYAETAGAARNGITGAGAAKRIAKFTGASTIGSSAIYQSSQGTIGIRGAPFWSGFDPGGGPDLHVNAGQDFVDVWLGSSNSTNAADVGRLSFVGSSRIAFNPMVYAAITGRIIDAGTYQKGALLFHTVSPLTLPSGGGLEEKMRIMHNGNVGIGTESPAGILHVSRDGTSGDLFVDSGSGKVGVGTSSPAEALEVAAENPGGLTAVRVRNTSNAAEGQSALLLAMGETDFAKFYTKSSMSQENGNALHIENLRQNADLYLIVNKSNTPTKKITLQGTTGRIGIHTYQPQQDLDIDGVVRIRKWGTLSGLGYSVMANANGDLYKGLSSGRYKRDVTDLNADEQAVLDLRPVRFKWKQTGAPAIGLIAEEVEPLIPELVVRDEQGRPDAVRYDMLSVYLLGVVRQLKDQNEKLREQMGSGLQTVEEAIESLRRENTDLRERLARFESASRQNSIRREEVRK